jgi:hypothetical protein
MALPRIFLSRALILKLNLTFNLILYKCRKYGKIKLTTLVGGKHEGRRYIITGATASET